MGEQDSGDVPIMVVEDDFFIRELLVDLLEDEGYTAVSAANGQEALAALRAMPRQPSLILLDLHMPVMDGRRFRELQQLDASLCSIPVVLLSACGDGDELPPSLHCDARLAKPIDLLRLRETIETLSRASAAHSPHAR